MLLIGTRTQEPSNYAYEIMLMARFVVHLVYISFGSHLFECDLFCWAFKTTFNEPPPLRIWWTLT